jgi:type IV pilus assembly protein PilX
MSKHLPSSLPRLTDQRGFSLIVALMMLIVIIILGISGSQMAINEERGSRNDRDRQIAFQAAEAALKDAEQEIFGATAPVCNYPGQVNRGTMRSGTTTCFNEVNQSNYTVGCSSATPSSTSIEGLCSYVPYTQACQTKLASNSATTADCPGYLMVDFLGDAAAGSSATVHTVAYGQHTGRNFPSQKSTSTATLTISIYPPRYIIELVPKNTSIDTLTSGQKWMFRVTAIGFGATANTQVVLQTIVATSF